MTIAKDVARALLPLLAGLLVLPGAAHAQFSKSYKFLSLQIKKPLYAPMPRTLRKTWPQVKCQRELRLMRCTVLSSVL